jgi:transcription antitermination protein NusB
VANVRTRRSARERSLQFLFGLEFTGYHWEEEFEDFWSHFPTRSVMKPYTELLVRGVCENQAELDQHIDAALDKWTPDRVGRIERVILRIALFEMMHVPDVPSTVVINEAIEVAKRFGSDETPRFVNGVLDRLKKTLSDLE